jgi:hypothetical protein
VRTARDAAQEIVSNLKKTYATTFTIVRVEERAFSHLDLSTYRRFQETLERSGYKFLGDIAIVEINNSPTSLMAPTMIRTMLSADGATDAGYYQVRPRIGRLVKNLLAGIANLRLFDAPAFFLENLGTKHCYDFTSEIAGTYVTTSNAAGAAAISLPNSVDAKFFTYQTPLAEVRTAHEARLAAAVRRVGASPTKMSSNEDVRAMQARLKQVKDAHRLASNWITRKELVTLAGGDTELADAVFEEVQKLLGLPTRPEEQAGD